MYTSYITTTMETLTTSPELSKVSLEKKNALQEVVDTIFSRAGESATSEQLLQAATDYLEEVRGNYRLEQATAKLQEYYQLEIDTEMQLSARRKELDSITPGVGDRLRAVNDDRFSNLSSPDERYQVAS